MNSTKVKGLILAVLMVGSVFAATATPAAAATTTDVSLSPSSASVDSGNSATFDVVLGTADAGVGAFDNITVSVDDTSTATISDVQLGDGLSAGNSGVADDGSSAYANVPFGGDTNNTGEVTLLTVTVQGENAGEANLDVNVTGDISDENGQLYTVDQVNGGTLTVEGQTAEASSTISADPATAGSTSTHTVEATVGSSAGGSSLTGLAVDYSVSSNAADVSNVGTSDVSSVGIDTDGDGTIETDVSDDLDSVSSSNNGETVTFDFGGSYSLSAGDVVIVEFANAQNPSSAGDYSVDVTVNPQNAAETSTATLSVTSSDDGGEDEVDADKTITAGSANIVYQGQDVASGEGGFQANENVILRQGSPDDDSTYRNEYTANSNGVVTFGTDNRQTGQDYFLRGAESGNIIEFEVVEHDFTASVGSTDLGNAGSEATTTLEFDSNRRNSDVYVTNEDLSASELADITADLNPTEVDLNGDGVADSVMVSAQRNTEYTLDFGGVDEGNYTLTYDVVDTTASAETDFTVSPVSAGTASLTPDSFEVAEGGVADITVELSGAASSGTLVIGNVEEDGYQANISFTDGNNDGEVTVEFNTYTAGSGDGVVSAAADDDSATLTGETSLTAMLAGSSDYLLTVSTSDSAEDTMDEPQEIGSLFVNERSTTENMTLWTAPGGASLDADGNGAVTASDVSTLVEAGAVTQDTTITAGDYVVHQISATGLDGLLAEEGGLANALLEADGGLSLTVEQTDPIQNRDPKVLDIENSTDALTLVEGDDTYYVVVDTRNAEFTRNGDSVEAAPGNEFQATLTIEDDRLLRSESADAHASVTGTFTLEAPDTELSADTVEVAAADGQNISGTTNYAPGTELTIRIRSDNDVQPGFYDSATVTVQADGSFSAQFDFSEQSAGDTFGISIRKGGSDIASANGEVVESVGTPTATPEPTETATPEPTETATPEPTETDAAGGDDTETEPSEDTTTTTTPGFGVAVALVALLAAALLAGRRE